MFETETVGPCVVQKLKWGHGLLAPSGYTPALMKMNVKI